MNLGIKFITVRRRFSKRRDLWVMSTWTGEVVKPWQLRRITGMVRDYRRHLIRNEFGVFAE